MPRRLQENQPRRQCSSCSDLQVSYQLAPLRSVIDFYPDLTQRRGSLEQSKFTAYCTLSFPKTGWFGLAFPDPVYFSLLVPIVHHTKNHGLWALLGRIPKFRFLLNITPPHSLRRCASIWLSFFPLFLTFYRGLGAWTWLLEINHWTAPLVLWLRCYRTLIHKKYLTSTICLAVFVTFSLAPSSSAYFQRLVKYLACAA
jgi:hypothetical protein